jgi:hypothetical protein
MWVLIVWFLSGRVKYFGPFEDKPAAMKFYEDYVKGKLPGRSGDPAVEPLVSPNIAGL